jgi:hypothetical protein
MDHLETLANLEDSEMHPEKQTQLLGQILAELQKLNDQVKRIDDGVSQSYEVLKHIDSSAALGIFR